MVRMIILHPVPILVLLAELVLAACAGSPSAAVAPATPTAPLTAATTGSSKQTPASGPAPAPTRERGLLLPPRIDVLAESLNSPDDLALGADGTIFFSDTRNGTISKLTPNGTVTTLMDGLSEPEGIVVLPDGRLIVVEQGRDRLLLIKPYDGQVSTAWLALENKTGKPGLDNIIRDPKTGDLLIPDSPNGRFVRVTSEKQVDVIATDFIRPTGIDLEPDGSMVLADEYAGVVKRVRTDRRIETLGEFSSPDDVVVDRQGNIFVASLSDNSIGMIDVRSGSIIFVATIQSPQGIILDAEDNLIVTEPARHRIVRLHIH